MKTKTKTSAKAASLLDAARRLADAVIPHHHPMDYWETKFPDIAVFVKNAVYPSAITSSKKITVVKADVKSGKRLVAECFAAYTNGPQVINVFMSAYIRKADAPQRYALESYMLGGVYTLNTTKHALECLTQLRTLHRRHPEATIVVHFDEFDHGSGTDQMVSISGLWDYINVCSAFRVVQYSASPEEALLSVDDDRRCVVMPVHRNYRGARYYLEANLVRDAESPLKYSEEDPDVIVGLSQQLCDILTAVRDHVRMTPKADSRRLVVVRVTHGFAKLQDMVHKNQIPEFVINEDDEIVFDCGFVASTSSGTTKVEWDNFAFWQQEMIRMRRMNAVRVLFIDQMCTRSTDWFCHPFLYAYHDYHGKNSALNTIIQSNLRVSYYLGKKNDIGEQVYGMEEHPILLYGCQDVIEFVAGRRTLDDMERRVSSRAVVGLKDPNIWGRPMRFSLPVETVKDSRFTDTIRSEEQREWIKSQILASPEITHEQRNVLTGRRLAAKRNYHAHNTLGGIHTVHARFVEGRESRPGGGIPDERMYDERDKYFWIDVAQEITEGIPPGTVYVTYGLPESEEIEDTHEHRLAYGANGRSRSIFGLPRV